MATFAVIFIFKIKRICHYLLNPIYHTNKQTNNYLLINKKDLLKNLDDSNILLENMSRSTLNRSDHREEDPINEKLSNRQNMRVDQSTINR